MATRLEFRSLLHYLNREIDNWLPNSIPTIQTWTLRTYKAQKQRIRHEVQAALSKVHFTVDLWTSLNALAILGIIAHYISETGKLEHFVLALEEVDGEHTGQYSYINLFSNLLMVYLGLNQVEHVLKVISDYGIISKVGYFVIDNASNNNTIIEALSTCELLSALYLIRYAN
jgi:hypothetical protein